MPVTNCKRIRRIAGLIVRKTLPRHPGRTFRAEPDRFRTLGIGGIGPSLLSRPTHGGIAPQMSAANGMAGGTILRLWHIVREYFVLLPKLILYAG